MTSSAQQEFGYAVRQARLDLGWTLEKLAEEALGNGARKGYVGQVEKGTRNLSPETIDKFDQALSLPADIVKAAHLAPPLAKTNVDEDKRDSDAERLLTKVSKDETIAPVAEALLTTLAYEFAGGQHRDIHTAYISLRQALEAAETIRKRGEMPPDNTGSQLNAVMAEVAKLNDQGALEDADALLEAEEKRMREEHKAEKDRLDQQAKALLERRLDQDRLRNDPDAAATRLIKDIYRQSPAGGVFRAISLLSEEWRDNGDPAGDIFALNVALSLAKANYHKRAKGKKAFEVAALYTLGWCHLLIAQRSTNEKHLTVARNTFEAAVQKTNKSKEPFNWSVSQDGLSSALRELGMRASDPAVLMAAVKAQRAALKVKATKTSKSAKVQWNNLGTSLQALGQVTKSPETLTEAEAALLKALSLEDKMSDQLDWEVTQNNLALAQRWLGDVTDDLVKLDEARAGYAACEELDFEDKAPFIWARLQWNIADLALARFRLNPDLALLAEARDRIAMARAFFVDGSDYQTERCDDLLAQVEKAGAAAKG